jgi:hypothetical protein
VIFFIEFETFEPLLINSPPSSSKKTHPPTPSLEKREGEQTNRREKPRNSN